MASLGFLGTFVAVLLCFFILFLYYLRHRRSYPKSWPVVGMLLELVLQIDRIHEKIAEMLELCECAFLFNGPWFAKMNTLFTVDPANIQYVMSTKFSNYPKGEKFQELFECLGGGFFNVDGESWRCQRKVAQAFLTDKRFFRYLLKITKEKIDKGLLPVLENAAKNGSVVDLQDLFQRFGNDITWIFVTGHDPESLSPDLPEVSLLKALDDLEETVLRRYLKPETFWKFQRWLNVGQERKHKEARKAINKFIADYLSTKREIHRKQPKLQDDKEEVADLLSSYMKEVNDDSFLRDTILNFLVAGRESTSSTLTWFTWLVATKPEVRAKLREELQEITSNNQDEEWKFFNVEELTNMVYLHATLCETLRLYPTVPFQCKSPTQPDILPTGHKVYPDTRIMFPRYAMGRMTKIWGKGSYEFRPERWINEQGQLKHESSYKFFAFNAGPRICPGKEMSILQLKCLAAWFLCNYDIRILEGHPIVPSNSVILHMKHGLMARISKRCA